MPNFKTIDAGTCGVMLRSLVTLLSWPGRWPSTVLRRLLGDDRGCIDECQNSKWWVMIEPMTINDETTSYKFNQCKQSLTILLQSMAMQMSNVMNISFFDLRMFWGMFDSHLLEVEFSNSPVDEFNSRTHPEADWSEEQWTAGGVCVVGRVAQPTVHAYTCMVSFWWSMGLENFNLMISWLPRQSVKARRLRTVLGLLRPAPFETSAMAGSMQ